MSKALIGIDKSGSFRIYLTISTDMVETARQIHLTTPLATAGLGRVLTAAGLMGIMLKGKRDKLTLQFKGDGPAQQILATAKADGTVKGYIANPDVELPLKPSGKLDVGGSLGIGMLTVIKDLGLKDSYVGSIALVNGEIAEDLTTYYYISEQQNTSVALGVKVDTDYSVACSGGMIIQMLPDAKEGSVEALEKMIGQMPPMTTVIEQVAKNNVGKSESGILEELFLEIFKDMPEAFSVEKLEERDIRWECDCSHERLEKILVTIGRKDMKEIIEEDGQAELVCQFCTKKYLFTKEELQKLYEQM